MDFWNTVLKEEKTVEEAKVVILKLNIICFKRKLHEI